MAGSTFPELDHVTGLTVNPQALSKDITHNPHQSRRFNAEEWENWMQWDGATDSFTPKSLSDDGNASVRRGGSLSHGSTSPSETESLQLPPLTPVYQIPIEEGPKKAVPDKYEQTRRQPAKKRKTLGQADANEGRIRQPKGQKISHNVIEKRYRTNLNDKIARLRDSVPVLKTAFEASQKQTTKPGVESGSEDSGSDDKANGLKFNKATVLTKATEYIEQLEKANARLNNENSTLRRRVREDTNDVHAPKPLYFRADEAHATGSSLITKSKAQIERADTIASPVSPDCISGKIPVAAEFQRLRAEAADQPSYAPTAPTPEPLSPSPTALGTESIPSTPATQAGPEMIDFDSVKGSIPVPDYVTRNRVPISQQQHYAPPTDGRRYLDTDNDPFVLDDEEPRAWWPRNRASKLLLGSLAGLMIMEGFNANLESPKPAPPSHQKRGHNFLPSDFYTESRGFRAQIRQRIIDFGNSPRGRKAMPVLMLAAVILTIVFIALIYWSRKDAKRRRRANSVSATLDRSDEVHEIHDSSKEAGGSSRVLPLSDRAWSLNHGGLKFVRPWTLFSEAALRLRGCWHVLTTGETFYRDFGQRQETSGTIRIATRARSGLQ